MSAAANRRAHGRQIARISVLEDSSNDAIDHYTEQDRKTAETLEAAELFREFLSEEFA